MNTENNKTFPYTWEKAIDILRSVPEHQQLIFDAYLTSDIINNCNRFYDSEEYKETLRLIKKYHPSVSKILDIPGGNGIATCAFAKDGFSVTTVEPDESASVGRGAIDFALNSLSLGANIVDAFGENLPFEKSSFDVVYVRQGLHHASNLDEMLNEYFRVLRPGGVLMSCREHVVDNYDDSLTAFLDSQVDHQLYGGEHAFTLDDYRGAFEKSGFQMLEEIAPYDSPINLYPNTPYSLEAKILESKQGKLLRLFMTKSLVARIGLWRLKKSKLPGRLYSFVAKKADV